MGLNVLHAEVAEEGSAARVIHVLSLGFSSSSSNLNLGLYAVWLMHLCLCLCILAGNEANMSEPTS